MAIFQPLISATNKLIGKATAGTGLVEEISLGNQLTFKNSTLNSGLEVAAVHYAVTGALTVTSSGSGVGQTLTNAGVQAAFTADGATPSVGQRIAVLFQANQESGIYTLTNAGSGASNWVLTRATDFDGSDAGTPTFGTNFQVQLGSTLAGVIYTVTNLTAITVGSTTMTFQGNSATSGGSLSGSGAASRVAYWSSASALTSSANLAYNGNLLTLLATTEQLRVGYDASNYTNFTVGSTATVTTNIVGTTPTLLTQFAGTEVGYWRPSSTQLYLGTTGSGNSGTSMTVIGQSNTIHATKNSIVVLGSSNTANMASSVVVGRANTMNDTSGTGDGSVIFGSGNTVGYQRSVALGRDITATGSGVVSVGYGTSATGNNSTSFGINMTNTVTNTMKFGLSSTTYFQFDNTGIFNTVASGTTQFTISAAGVVTAKGLNVAGSNAATLGSFNQISTGTSITSPFPAFELVNSDATANNFTTFSFADAVSGASYALIGGQCTDHTNNYGNLQFWTRAASGTNVQLNISATGLSVGNTTTMARTRLDIVETTANAQAASFTGTNSGTGITSIVGIQIINSAATTNMYSGIQFVDVLGDGASAAIAGQFTDRTNNYGDVVMATRAADGFLERLRVTNAAVIAAQPVRLKGYTVATLPAGTQGDTAYATDLLGPTFFAAAVGGGAVVGPVFHNGTIWICT